MELSPVVLTVGAVALVLVALWLGSRSSEAPPAPADGGPPPSDAAAFAAVPALTPLPHPAEESFMQEHARTVPEPTPSEEFSDTFTSATADLSAGGVAMTREHQREVETFGVAAAPGTTPPASEVVFTAASSAASTEAAAPASTPASGTWADRPLNDPSVESARPFMAGGLDYHPREDGAAFSIRNLSVGGGVLAALASAVGGAWLFARWQRERNRPINRLRRGARTLAGRVGDRLPAPDELAEPGPVGGAAAGLVVLGLLLSRLVGDGERDRAGRDADRAAATASLLAEQVSDVGASRLVDRWRALQDRVPPMPRSLPEPPVAPLPMGVGLGGVLATGAAGYLVWRLLRGDPEPEPRDSAWYVGPESSRQVPNQ